MVSFANVLQAAGLFRDKTIRRLLVYSPAFSRIASAELYLKLENL